MKDKKYSFKDLVDIMKKLLSKKGCPWDKEQTHQTLREFLLEETYEVIETIDSENYDALKVELGDLLLQIVFHSELAKKKDRFDINDVIRSICQKLVRRHPHVFSGNSDISKEEVLQNWEEIKLIENKEKSMLDGLPKTLPALLLAQSIQNRVSRVGFDWSSISEVVKKIKEEIKELDEVISSNDKEKIENEIGDVLFSVVNLARFLSISAESSLRKTNTRFKKRFAYIEKQSILKNIKLEKMSLKQMNEIWEKAKDKM